MIDRDFIRLIWHNRLFDHRDLNFSDRALRFVRSIGTNDPNDEFLYHGVELIHPLSGAITMGSARIDTVSSEMNPNDTQNHHLILHIVGKQNKHVLTDRGELLTLVIEPRVELMQTASRMALDCVEHFSTIDSPSSEAIKLRLLSERLERKGREVLATQNHLDDWHETLYICLMRSFGYKEKKDEFERLARSVPYRYVMRHSHRTHMVEAIMLGQAGFLDVDHADEYTTQLQQEWVALKHETALSEPIISWRDARTRPSSLPAISIIRAVAILTHITDLMDEVLEAKTGDELRALFDIALPVYWRFHYAPSREAGGNFHSPNLSTEKLNLIIINCISPFLWALGTACHKDDLVERSLDLLDQTSAEHNTYTRRWLTERADRPTAFDSQAIIELCTSYCARSRCTACPIGAHRLQQTYQRLQP